jgi:hypothetical protein
MKGDRSHIKEYPDQEIYDTCGFTLVVLEAEGEPFTPDDVFRHLTSIDDTTYADTDIRTMSQFVLQLTFPVLQI